MKKGSLLCAAWGAMWGALAALAPSPVCAQGPETPYAVGGGRLTLGGNISAALGPADSDAFFNYTDYERNTLRLFRVRLMGEWRAAARLALIAEVRTENGNVPVLSAALVRWQPWMTRPFAIRAGRIPPVIGAFARRAYSRDAVVFGVPLAYQYLTSLRPDALPLTMDDLLRMRGRGWRPSFPLGSRALATGVPLVSATRWDTGVQASWQPGRWDLAAAVTRGSPANPVVRETNEGLTLSGRAAARVPGGLVLGVSGARGQWLDTSVLALVARGARRPSSQSIVGIDGEGGAGRWLVRGEWLRSMFEIPIDGDPVPDHRLTAWSGFVETRYRIVARWQVGLRLERLDFSDVRGTLEGRAPAPWDAPVDRAEAAVGFRATRQLELRAGVQRNWRPAGRVHDRVYPVAGFLYWF